MTFELTVNGQAETVDVDPDMPVLWALRDVLNLTGTKYACGRGLCGSCTVHMDGQPVRSCVISVAAAQGRSITTIEGLGRSYADHLHPVQAAWIEADVSQCGFCQPGQIMQAASLLRGDAVPSDSEIDRVMSSVLCRCGSYTRIRKAIRLAARRIREQNPQS